MKNRPIWLLSTVLCAACAGRPPAELVSARQSYARASRGPAAQLAPGELARSRALLDQAELKYADSAGSRRARDYAYASERQAQRAEALAMAEQAKREKSSAELALVAAQAEAQRRANHRITKPRARAMSAGQRAEAERKARLASEPDRVGMESLRRTTSVRDDPRGTQVTIPGAVMFSEEALTLLPSADARLDDLAEVYRRQPEQTVTVETLGDGPGSDEYRQWLRRKRAEAVRSSLIARGVPAERIRVSSDAAWRIRPGEPTTIEVIFAR